MPWSCTLICTSAELSPIPTRSADIPTQRLWPLYFTALAIRFCKHWDSSDRSPATGGKSGFISLPTVKIWNGVLRAKVYLPDGEKGFYRGMRFDWAGVMASLEYKSHGYLGPFFEKFDPAVSGVEIGNPVVAGIAAQPAVRSRNSLELMNLLSDTPKLSRARRSARSALERCARSTMRRTVPTSIIRL